ncbi:MAG: xanthine dehydrogenase family protein subunit M [Bacteroidota bacterium]
MIPSNFAYKRAGSVAEAIQLLGDGDTKILAGGHSLIPAMKLRLNAPETLVDIARIPELRYVRAEGSTIAIGAAATHHDVMASDAVKTHLPALSEMAAMIGDVQVRNRGTIGGALAHADPAADYPAMMLAANAEMVVQGPSGSRTIAAADFFVDLFETALGENEILTEIRVPALPAGATSAYVKFYQPASRYAIVGCAVILSASGGSYSDVRVGFTSVGSIAFRDAGVENALNGQAVGDAAIEAAAQHAANGVDVLEDHFASAAYRQHLARVMAKRALKQATERI